jgi:hypothetical protein
VERNYWMILMKQWNVELDQLQETTARNSLMFSCNFEKDQVADSHETTGTNSWMILVKQRGRTAG